MRPKKLNVDGKDWDRLIDLIVSKGNDEAMAKKITDKNKAINRYVAGIKLLGETPSLNTYSNGEVVYYNSFSSFANKAIKLGATPEEIESVYNSTEIPNEYIDKFNNLKGIGLSNDFINDILKTLLKNGYTAKLIGKGGSAKTMLGKAAMSINGRKWTISYTIDVDGMKLAFDVITSEGGGASKYVINSYESDPMFTKIQSKELGKREFIGEILSSLD